MAAYTIKCDYQQVKSLIDIAAIQSNDEDGWIRLINTISAPCDEIGNEIIYKAKSKEQTINRYDILRAQMKHSTIRTVIELKQRRANQQIDKKQKRKSHHHFTQNNTRL